MQIKEIPLGRIGLDKQTLVGLSVVAFSSLVGTSKDNDLFGKINKSKDEYWHQFLTSYGDISFTFAMTSFLTFLRGLHPPCTFDKFVQYYNNTYSNGFQTQLNLFPESEAA